MDLSPIKLAPAVKDYLWGGTKLITEFNKKTELDKAAESWELSTHKDGPSTVVTGSFKGKTLPQYIEENGKDCIGKKAAAFDFFPILIKLIDAKDNLSIQVHPDDEYALKNEHEYGKTEMWYIVDCEKDSYLYYGLNREISKEEFAERISNNTILEVLNKVPVHKGDVFFIPSGTIHAICAGILICEIQQNSNTTYRVYDYNRVGADGKCRELHIDKAIAVTSLCPPPKQEQRTDNVLASCKYFTVKKLECDGHTELAACKDCFRSIIVLDGSGTLRMGETVLELNKGDSVFIPAQEGNYTIDGKLDIILSYV
ncbi:MAG: class I mannose-6-phosphate isomerase [Clostridiales bacterium]|nr:class I mannose-6-phosphate isomerase [Clostridiales bacterium]